MPAEVRGAVRGSVVGTFVSSPGQAADMEIHAKEMLETRDRLNKILAKHTGQSVDRIKQDTDRDRFMDWSEAVKYGLIDRVLEKRGELPATPSKPA